MRDKKQKDMKLKGKNAAITYYGVSAIWFVLALYEMLNDGVSTGVVSLCLGAMFMCLGAVDNVKNKDKEENESTGNQRKSTKKR